MDIVILDGKELISEEKTHQILKEKLESGMNSVQSLHCITSFASVIKLLYISCDFPFETLVINI